MKKPKMVTCRFCEEKVPEPIYRKHLLEVHDYNFVTCPHCKSTMRTDLEKDHMCEGLRKKRQEMVGKVKVNCPHCRRRMRKDRLATHIKEFHSPSQLRQQVREKARAKAAATKKAKNKKKDAMKPKQTMKVRLKKTRWPGT